MRWFLAGLLLTMLLVTHAWTWSLIHLILFLGLLWVLEGDVYRVWQGWVHSWRILRWLLIPMILLHIFFTPGAMIWVGSSLPVSYEGLNLAMHLSMHLIEIFVCALLLGRLLPMQSWLQMIARSPVLMAYLLPYLHLMPMMSRRIQVLVRKTYRAWRLERKKIRQLPNYIMMLMLEIEKSAQLRAKYVWKSWDKLSVSAQLMVQSSASARLNYMIYILLIYTVIEFGVRY